MSQEHAGVEPPLVEEVVQEVLHRELRGRNRE
jgi:hypothetical protein